MKEPVSEWISVPYLYIHLPQYQHSIWNTLDAQYILVEWVNLTGFGDKLLWWYMFLGTGHHKVTEFQAYPEITVPHLLILKIKLITKEVIT